MNKNTIILAGSSRTDGHTTHLVHKLAGKTGWDAIYPDQHEIGHYIHQNYNIDFCP